MTEIDAFIDTSPEGCIFCRDWWLDAVAPKWEYITIKDKDKLVAIMPIAKYGRDILMPPLTQTLGIMFTPMQTSYAKTLSRQHQITEEIIENLPPFRRFEQSFHYAYQSFLPFYWHKFHETTRCTYVIHDLNPDRVWDEMRKNIRTDIRKAARQAEVSHGSINKEFHKLNAMVYNRLGIPYEQELIDRIEQACKKHSACDTLYARDRKDQIHATIFIVWDNHAAYYLISAADPELKHSGATSLLIWEAIRQAASITKEFNFEGSMVQEIERHFAAFGARQEKYHQISKSPIVYDMIRKLSSKMLKKSRD